MSVKLKPLTAPLFLVGLFLLLLNDFYLKGAFHNSFTGKLSDICGLFIFPIFWSVIFPRRKFAVYIFTALFFTYWKSSYSGPFIDLFSRHIFPVQRTIDLTDLLALIVLPLSWHFQSTPQKRTYFNPYLAGLIAFFSFCATSRPRSLQHFEQPQYILFQSSSHLVDSTLVNQGLRTYHFDSLTAVGVEWIEGGAKPIKDDDFNKNLALKNLEQTVLQELPGPYKVLPSNQINRLTIKTTEYQDDVIFKGSRLHGKFLRKNQGQLLIDGQFKDGIEDSVWTFINPSQHTTLKKTFKNGETTRIEEFTSSKLTSSKSVSTRQETSIFKGLQLALLLVLCLTIVVRLRKNHKTVLSDAPDMKIVYKLLLCISLPFLTWLIQLMIGTVIPDHNSDFFEQIASLFFIYIIGLPAFTVLLFWVKPKRQTDILWYCALLSLLFLFWHEAITLDLLLEN